MSDGLSVTILGCSGTYAGPGGACSGYLVRSATTTLWVDTGPGTMGPLQQHVTLDDVDAVLISHVHPDHWLDLPVLRNVDRYVTGRSGRRVISPAEVLHAATAVLPDVAETFDWQVVADGARVSVGDIDVEMSRTDHPVETLAMRFDDGHRSIGYSADTGPAWSMDRFSAPVDLALWEATYATDAGSSPHTSALDVGRLAAAAGVGRLVLTHLLPGSVPADHLAAAAEHFDGPVDLARPGECHTA